VFDVLLNGDHLVVDGLDIFERAGGRAAAFDVHIPFKVTGNKLVLLSNAEESDLPNSRILRLDFVKVFFFVIQFPCIKFNEKIHFCRLLKIIQNATPSTLREPH
jgi:hypothetical protein